MITSSIKTEKVTLLIIWSFFAIYLPPSLHARTVLPSIKNGTAWTVSFVYNWVGCGAGHGDKHGGGDHHHDKVKVSSGGAHTFSQGCISRVENPSITVFNPKVKHGNETLKANIIFDLKGNVSYVEGPGYYCNKGSSCTLVLKYDSSYPQGHAATNGFYWEAAD